MTELRKHEIVTGLFILAAVLVFALFAFQVGSLSLSFLRPDVLECQAFFRDVQSLEPGARVVVGGSRVGRVASIGLVPPEQWAQHADEGELYAVIRVRFEINDTQLGFNPRTAAVKLTRDGLLGIQYLSLDPGTWEEGERPISIAQADLEEPVTLPVAPAPGLDALMGKAELLLDDLRQTMSTVNTQFVSPDNSVGLLAILAEAQETVVNARSLLQRFNELAATDHPDGLHQRVILPLESLLTTTEQEITELSKALQEETIVYANEFLLKGQAVMEDAQDAVGEGRAILEEGNPKVQAFLDNLQATSAQLDGHLVDVKEDLQALLKNADGTLGENRADLREVIRRMRRTMWQAEMTFRKVRANPAYILFGDDEMDLEALTTDETDARFGGRARPYEQRDERDAR